MGVVAVAVLAANAAGGAWARITSTGWRMSSAARVEGGHIAVCPMGFDHNVAAERKTIFAEAAAEQRKMLGCGPLRDSAEPANHWRGVLPARGHLPLSTE